MAGGLAPPNRHPNAGLHPALHRTALDAFRHFETWVEGHRLAAHVCLLARRVEQQGNAAGPGDRSALLAACTALEAFADRVAPLAADPEIPHQIVMLLDPHRARDTAAQGRACLGAG